MKHCESAALNLELLDCRRLPLRTMSRPRYFLRNRSSLWRGWQTHGFRRRKIELAELVNEPWTWSAPGTMFDTLVIDAFRTTGLEPPRATVYAEAINVRIRLAATGPFLAVIPASMLKFHAQHASIKKLSVELPMTQRSIGVITLKNRTLSPLAQNFIECAREAAKPLSRRQ